MEKSGEGYLRRKMANLFLCVPKFRCLLDTQCLVCHGSTSLEYRAEVCKHADGPRSHETHEITKAVQFNGEAKEPNQSALEPI